MDSFQAWEAEPRRNEKNERISKSAVWCIFVYRNYEKGNAEDIYILRSGKMLFNREFVRSLFHLAIVR